MTTATSQPRSPAAIDWPQLSLPGIGADTTVLVTGGAGAIGYRVAEAFLALGARVAIMGRSPSTMEDAAKRLGHPGRVLALTGDISKTEDDKRVVAAVVATWGRLDVLVQSAAIGDGGPTLDTLTPEAIDAVLGTNVKGLMLMAQAAAVPMRAQRRGKIVNVGSVAGYRAHAGRLLYATSKSALQHLTRQLAVELSPYGINVNGVSPGQTPTRLKTFLDAAGGQPEAQATVSGPAAYERIPLRRRGVLDDYVGPIVFLASDLADYLSGIDIPAEGGIMATG
ncbi:MAG: SDR family oxidoreductase [Dehalococcoidia bacterium]|nr:SDR family oxidoreductase [Dehalococcoidia bacterium]